jgi:hypothetical protein
MPTRPGRVCPYPKIDGTPDVLPGIRLPRIYAIMPVVLKKEA